MPNSREMTAQEATAELERLLRTEPVSPEVRDDLEQIAKEGGPGAALRQLVAMRAADAALKGEREHAALQGEPEPEPAPDPLRPGILAGALIGELEQALEQVQDTHLPSPQDRAAAAATLRDLATAANAMDDLMRRSDTDTAGPVLPPDVVRQAATYLGRCAQMLAQAQTARGRFTLDTEPDELTTGPWAEVRIIPDGYEDLDPAAIARASMALAGAVR